MVLPPIQTQVGNQSDLYLHSPASPPYHPTMMPPLTLTNLPTMTSMSLIIFFLGYYIHVSNVSAFSLTPPHSKPSYGATNTHTHKIILKIKKKNHIQDQWADYHFCRIGTTFPKEPSKMFKQGLQSQVVKIPIPAVPIINLVTWEAPQFLIL